MPNQLPITILGMEILRKKSKPVKKIDSDFLELVEDMFYTMRKSNGQGIAAPQVNSDLAVCIVDVSHHKQYKDLKPFILINPVIEKFFGDKVIYEEGCLSIPGFGVDVERDEKIIIKYDDFALKPVTLEADDMLARVIQHEVDHLNGRLIVDFLTPEQKKERRAELTRIKKGDFEMNYPVMLKK
jgi:peptide deformylase